MNKAAWPLQRPCLRTKMNPVLQKDLLALLRLKRVAAVQIIFVAVLALIVLGTWPQGGVASAGAGILRAGDPFLMALTLGQIVLLVLLVPGVASVAISTERENNTLEMLYASRLKPMQIIAGKVAVAIGYPLLLLF